MQPDGVTVGSEPVLVGPFTWIPDAGQAAGDGHRCLLAAISAPDDDLEPGTALNPAELNNVAQRNLAVTNCRFQMPNPTTSPVQVSLRLVTDAAVESGDSTVDLVLPFQQVLFDLWSNQVGVEVTHVGTDLIVRMQVRDVTLPQFQLNAGGMLNLRLDLSLAPERTDLLKTARLMPSFDGNAVAGFTCQRLALLDLGDPR